MLLSMLRRPPYSSKVRAASCKSTDEPSKTNRESKPGYSRPITCSSRGDYVIHACPRAVIASTMDTPAGGYWSLLKAMYALTYTWVSSQTWWSVVFFPFICHLFLWEFWKEGDRALFYHYFCQIKGSIVKSNAHKRDSSWNKCCVQLKHTHTLTHTTAMHVHVLEDPRKIS